jgi:hypothetical protein
LAVIVGAAGMVEAVVAGDFVEVGPCARSVGAASNKNTNVAANFFMIPPKKQDTRRPSLFLVRCDAA